MAKKKVKKANNKKTMLESLEESVRKLARNMERARIDEYVTHIRRPWKILGLNLAIGIARGFGIAVGMTIVFAIVMYMISKMVNLPIIGQFIAQIVEIVNKYLSEGTKIKL